MKKNLPSVLAQFISYGLDPETPVNTVDKFSMTHEIVNCFHLSVIMVADCSSPESDVDTTIPRFLLEYGMNVNEYSRQSIATDHETALHKAIEGQGWGSYCNRRLPLVSLLLEWGARVNAKDYEEQTQLHLATRAGDSTLIRLLLDHKADVNAMTNTGMAPRHLAMQRDHNDNNFCPMVITTLLDHGADLNAEGFNAPDTALAWENTEIVKILLDDGATVSVTSNGTGCATILGAALEQIGLWYHYNSSVISDDNVVPWDLSLIKMLLDRGADSSMINIPWGNHGRTPLHTLLYRCNQYWPNLWAI
ncbi:ankyrin repeat-containing domain protein [Pyronema domesticum]|nr:ankyrin repeat-containing domain protein [Pyronema domesticum]